MMVKRRQAAMKPLGSRGGISQHIRSVVLDGINEHTLAARKARIKSRGDGTS